MSSKKNRNSKKLQTNQKNAIKSQNVVTNNNNTKGSINNGTSSAFKSDSRNSVNNKSSPNINTNNQSISSVKTSNNSSPKTTGEVYNASIGSKSIDLNVSALKGNLGEIKTNNNSSINTTGGVNSSQIGIKPIDLNASAPRGNLGEIKTGNNSNPKTTGEVNSSQIGIKPIDLNVTTPKGNLGEIKTSNNSNPKTTGEVNSSQIGIKPIDLNVTTPRGNLGEIKTSNNSSPKTTGEVNNSRIGIDPIDLNVKTPRGNLGEIKTGNNSNPKTTGEINNSQIGIDPIDLNVKTPRGNLGEIKTGNNSNPKTTGGVNSSQIGIKPIDLNVKTPKGNLGEIKTSNNSNPKTTGEINNSRIGIDPIDLNVKTPRGNLGEIKTGNNSNPKTTGEINNSRIGIDPIDLNVKTPRGNLGEIKTGNNSSPKTTGEVNNSRIGIDPIDLNVKTPRGNLGEIKTGSNSSPKTTGEVDSSQIGIKPIDLNVSAPKGNLGEIRTSSNLSLPRENSINIKRFNKLPDSPFVKNVGYKIKTKVKSDFNRLAQSKVLEPTMLDVNYHNEIGSNTLKASYNTIVKTKRGMERTIKTAKQIKNIPTKYREVKIRVRNIPTNLRNDIETIKRTSKAIGKSSKIIISNVRKGDLIGALKEVPIKKIGKTSLKGASKVLINGGKISKKATLRGFNQFGRSFKRSAIGKTDETGDIGSNVVFGAVDTVKKSIQIGAKTTKTTHNVYNKIQTIRNNLNFKSTKIGTIKTKKIGSFINNQVKYHFNKFKSSYASKNAIKKYINKIKDKFKELITYVFRIIFKNPIVLAAIAVIVVISIVFSSILNSVLGFHGSYFIEIDNQNEWITNMNKLDSNIRREVNDHNTRIVRDSGTRADWRDVIIAYYIKNNYNSSLSGSGTTSLGSGTTSVDQATWDNIYKELQLYLGTPYQWGGSDPSTGFDCSGLVQYCYGKYGVSLPRTTYEQVLCGTHVEEEDMKAGDLVFFGTSDDVHHVGVYIGNGQFLHAPQTGDVVKISNVSDMGDFYEARRVLEVKDNSTSNGGTSGSQTSTNTGSSSDKILYTALPDNKDLVDIFYKVEQETGVDAILLASIAMQESSLNPNEVSGVGASGLCQLMPDTFTELGFDTSMIFDPYTNVLACADEVKSLYNYSVIKSVSDMLTAYNGGIGNFMKYDGPIPNNSENDEYAGKVLNYYTQLSNGEQPATMAGGTVTGANNVNTSLSKTYQAFIRFYKVSKKKWALQYYTVEEALNNLGFTEDEKEEFYQFKEYNDKFDDSSQFGGYNLDFNFNVE